MQTQEQIIVLDFGSQYSQLIARRIRECQVYSQVLPFSTPLARIRELAPKGIILSGGPCSVYEPGAPQVDPALFDLGLPVLAAPSSASPTPPAPSSATSPAPRSCG